MLHRFAQFLAGCTVLLVLAGSLVTSTQSGLSVPDWPTTYGWSMFTFPPSKWVGGILYEHGHRLIASTVGFLMIVLAVWLWLQDPRRWMKRLGVVALGAVIAQGVLGGLTVLFFLPAAISTAHAGLAEIFLCLTVAIALFTSPRWIEGYRPGGHIIHGSRGPTPARWAAGAGPPLRDLDDVVLRRLATATTVLIYVQILLGATMRHTGAGLAIPDFPLMFGRAIPPHWDSQIAIHFAHRAGALVVTLAMLATAARVWSRYRDRSELTRPASLAIVLVAVQIALGAATVLSRRDVWINSAHVVCGALVLTTSLVLALRTWRVKFATPPTATVRGVRLQADPMRDEVRLKPDATDAVGANATDAAGVRA
jgi:cytochrome c oxidase assembly protein subunit 15